MNRQAVLQSTVYVVLFVFFTLFFILVNYPSGKLTDQVNGWIQAPSKGTLTVENARIRPLLSLEVEGVTLMLDQGAVDMGEAVVDMHFLKLLSGKKGADVHLENPWLNSSLSVVTSGESWDIDVPTMEIDLSELPEDLMTLPVSMEGKMGVSLNLLSNDPAQGLSGGEVRITSGPIEIRGDLLETLGFAPLRLSRVFAVATVKDNVLTLGENAIEGDLMATARGTIRIAPANHMSSRLDLTLELIPGSESRERLAPVFALLGARTKADGSINIRVRGTIGRPSVTM